jgi:phage/plasmid-associated DNA primase
METITTTLPNAISLTLVKRESAFYLPKPAKSIYVGLECREYPTYEMMYGFLTSGMGVKLRKKNVTLYEDEQTHYTHYLKKISWIGDVQYVKTTHNNSSHQWGRINAEKSLSGSLFHRPTRHSFFNKNYLDFDMVNCQLDIALQLGKKEGLINLQGLEEYCANPKKCRMDIAKHYRLRDIVSSDGVVLTAVEQAKKLPIRLAFGGEVRCWKQDYNVVGVPDLPLVSQLEAELTQISKLINECNPHIRDDLIGDDDFQKKTPNEQNRTIMALFAQTWERIIQEECIAHLVRTHPSVKLQDIIPSQDGFMPLKKQLQGIDLTAIFKQFEDIQMNKFGFAIKWTQKPFDECIDIPLCNIMPIHICYEDLEKGERHIAELIYPAFKTTMKFYQDKKKRCWYYLDKTGLWVENSSPDTYNIIKILQSYIDKEADRLKIKIRDETDSDKKKMLTKIRERVEFHHYSNVGKPSFSSQLCKYLESLLKDNAFIKLLDNTAGKFVFADGILNLKTGKFSEGFKPEDYITVTSSIPYLQLVQNETKKQELLTELKKINNNNDTHLDYMLSVVGHSLTGDSSLEKSIYYIMDGTENQIGDNGKTLLFNLLKETFPDFVTDTEAKTLEDGYAKAHKNIDKWKNMRLVYCEEGTKKKVNASLIKKVGDGHTIENEIMFGVTEDIRIMFKMFVCTNHLPTIAKEEEAVYNRYKQLNLCSHFCRDGTRKEANPAKLEFIADTSLPARLKDEYRDEVVLLMMEYAMRYYKKGIPAIPEEYKRAVAKTKMQNNEFALQWNKHFEQHNGNISADEVASLLFMDRDTVIREAKRINISFNKDLTGFGSKKNKDGKDVYVKGGFTGWRVRPEEEEEEV